MKPEVIDDVSAVTPTWLTDVLRHGGFDGVVSDLTSAAVGTGQMGSTYRIVPTYGSGSGPETLVVKLPSADESARTGGAMGYRCETGFYRDVADEVATRVPTCWFADATDDARSFTLVLEDLAPASQGDQIAGCTVEQARAAAVNIAGLHASTWNDSSLRDFDWVLPFDAEAAEGIGAVLQDAVPGFAERLSLTGPTVDVLRAFADRFPDWIMGRPEPFSLLHGDHRLDNLLFAPADADDPVIAVDWQTVMVGLPLRDIGFLLATGLLPDDRRAAERDLVGDYHGALVDRGVEGYDADQCWNDYRFSFGQALMITMLGEMTANQSERGDRMFSAMAERATTAMIDLGTLEML